MRKIGKKGDNPAAPATYLILLIALFLIGYVILLPEAEKELLISDTSSVGTGTPTVSGGGSGSRISGGFNVLLQEVPGLVYPLEGKLVPKPLASANLFSFSETDKQGLANTVYIEKSTFSEKDMKLVFVVRDVKTVEDVQLLFLVKESKGEIIIDINGIEIYRGKAHAGDLPVVIPKGLLLNSNILNFRVSGTGVNLFSKHYFNLKDVQVFITERVENKVEGRQLVLNDKEVRGMQRMTLYFVVNCFTVEEQGRLVILFNGNLVADGLVVCDAGQVAIDLNPAYLVAGTNVLEFAIDNGRYVLEQMLVEEEIGAERSELYSFALQVIDIERLVRGGEVVMELRFPNDGLKKVGTVFLNGVPLYINQFEPIFSADVTPFVTEGQNSVRIIPDIPLDVAQITVTLF